LSAAPSRRTLRPQMLREKHPILGDLYYSQKPCIALVIDLMGTLTTSRCYRLRLTSGLW
jgi:hypothetical protein